ncbi:protein sidekick-2-like [Ruditapes philippinarum]|uniref:protein sidekick-2-like n=1 Tax=Ruditapes philippinarum TaxID=129788 RepID=UPI00295BBB4F|nr:protein sidekick-2-like [Ruditapes philippinarum]
MRLSWDNAGDIIVTGDNAGDIIVTGDNAGGIIVHWDNAGDMRGYGDNIGDIIIIVRGEYAEDDNAGDKSVIDDNTDNEVQEKYTYGQSAFDTYDKSCTNCNDDGNAKKTCGFYHIEASGNEKKNVTFRVVLTHTPTNLKWVVNSSNVYTVKVAIDVTCDSVNPLIQSDVTCICQNAPGTDIDWLIDDTFNSNCVLSTICAPQYSGYSYSMNTTENVYKMTINSYDYSNCTKITCKDTSDGSIMQSIIPSSLVFDTTFPTSMTEPGSNNSNGIISVKTGCISGYLDVQYDWYIIVGGLEERYVIYDTNIIDTIDNSSCINCDTDVNGQRTIGFEHIEASGSGTKTGLFKVSLYHVSTNLQLNLTSRFFYTVTVRPSQSENRFEEIDLCVIIIPSCVACLMLLSYIPAVVIYFNQQLSNKLHKVLNYKNCRLFIPFFGLYLIIKYCKLDKGSAQEFSTVNVEKTSIKVRWKRYDRNPSSDKIYYLKISTCSNINLILISDSGRTTFSYTFSNLQDSTVYDIELNCSDKADQNNVFKRYKSLKVRTKGVPDAPSEFRVDGNDITESSIRVRWEPGDDGGNRQTFVLTCSTKDRNIENIEIEHNGEMEMSYQLENLSEGTYYDLGLRGKSIEGLCTRIQSLKKRTLGKPDPPTNLRALNVTEKGMEVKWNAGSNGGYSQSFKLVVLNNEEQDNHDTNGKSDNHLTLKNLSPSTDYILMLFSTNTRGIVQCIEPLHVRTKGKPGQPKILRFENNDITATSITVRWDPGSDEGYKQTFVVTIFGKGISPTCDEIQDSGRKASWLKRWTQLSKATYYDITIYAKNKVGRSESLNLSIKTLVSKPDPPTEFVEDGVTETSITVKWEPGHDGGCKQSFYVFINENEYEAKENDAYTFESLTPNTFYNIALKAKNKEGEVYASSYLHIRTHGRPDTPKYFEIVDRTNSTITMKWEPGNDGGFSQNFILINLMDNQSHKQLTDPIQDTADHIMQHTITNLKDDSEFKLQVQAYNEKGTSSSKSVKVKTRKPRLADK